MESGLARHASVTTALVCCGAERGSLVAPHAAMASALARTTHGIQCDMMGWQERVDMVQLPHSGDQ